jgi:hypothetical protein
MKIVTGLTEVGVNPRVSLPRCGGGPHGGAMMRMDMMEMMDDQDGGPLWLLLLGLFLKSESIPRLPLYISIVWSRREKTPARSV